MWYKKAMRVSCLSPALLPVIIFLLGSGACIRLLPAPNVEEPSAAVDRHILCAAVEVKSDGARPGPEQSRFGKGRDEAVYSFLGFRYLRGIHAVSWKWYDPSRSLIRSTDPISIGGEGMLFDSYIAWDRIPVHDEREAGIWTVAVFVDNLLAGSRTFEIR